MATKPAADWNALPEPVAGVNRRWNGTSWTYFNPTTGVTYANATAAKAAMTPAASDELSNAQRDASVMLTNMFDQYGISGLAPKIMDFLKQGYSADAIALLLQQTPEYQQRFAGNKARQAAGLPVLSPAEYVATEAAYRQVMQAAGMPSGFYDSPSDFADFIGKGISPTEVQGRVNAASDLLNSAPPEALSFFKQYYSGGDMIAYMLDPSKALPIIEKQAKAAELAAPGIQAGVAVDQQLAERLATSGVSQGQAQQGFGFVAGETGNAQKLGAIYGDGVTQRDIVDETFFNDAQATKKRRTLASKERATFGGTSGVSKQSLDRNDAGAF